MSREEAISSSEKPNNCDLISRGEVLENAFKIYTHECGLLEVVGVATIKTLPSVKPQERTGHWITKIKSDLVGDMWPTNPKCSECGGEPYYSNTIYNYKFCPYCGARMESEKNE